MMKHRISGQQMASNSLEVSDNSVVQIIECHEFINLFILDVLNDAVD
jgi:hypothetical protein